MLTYNERWELCQERNVTLDGKPAAICGARLRFASVRRLHTTALSVPFAWETVQYIVENKNGKFKSSSERKEK